jgi:dTDP-4-dehydrorhamnose reductase
MRILVTGGSGYLGAALLCHIHATRPAHALYATYFSNPPALDFPSLFQLDLRDLNSIERVVHTSHPQVIVHTAAQMQGSFEALRQVNAAASGFLAGLANEIHARLIHLSTDVIFDGHRGNYREEDTPNPITDYARSKFQAEQAVQASGAETVIVRTSLIYGFAPFDPRTRAMRDGEMPRLFTDERRCPIWVENLCAALLELSEGDYSGILHVAGVQALSRYDFGERLARALGGDSSRLIPSRSAESGITRPLDCTLDCTRARRLLKTRLLGVDEVLAGL